MSRSFQSAFGVSKRAIKSAKEQNEMQGVPLPEGRYPFEVVSAALYLRHKTTGEELAYPAWGLVLNPVEIDDRRRVIVRLQAGEHTDMEKFSMKVNCLLAALGADAEKTFKVTDKEMAAGVKPQPDLKGKTFTGRITPATNKDGDTLVGLYDLNYVEVK